MVARRTLDAEIGVRLPVPQPTYPKKTAYTKFMKLNKKWHLNNKMPQNPTFEDRVKWHFEHFKHCKCRDMPKSIKEELKKKNLI